MIEVSGLSGDITFVVYDDVNRNMDERRLVKWANQCGHLSVLRVATNQDLDAQRGIHEQR
jgi:hypothetical protein